MRNPYLWIGLGGVERGDNSRAHYWQARLQVGLSLVALLAIPSYLLDASDWPSWHRLATGLDAFIFCAFLGETVWMAAISNTPLRYLAANWLNLVILGSTLASVFGEATGWVALARVLRVAVSGMLLTRTLTRFGVLFTRRGAPILVGTAFVILLSAGGLFYWLEPTIKSYWDGLWLAFVTGTTIGYGDVVPTSGPARMLAALTALLGVSLIALFTANIVSFFVGNDDAEARRRLQKELAELREEVAKLRLAIEGFSRDPDRRG